MEEIYKTSKKAHPSPWLNCCLTDSPLPTPAPSHAQQKAGLKPITGNPAVLGREQTLKIISPGGDTGWKYKLLPEGFR